MHERFLFRAPVHLVDVLQSARQSLAEILMLQAFVAYSSVHNFMKAAVNECHQHMQSQARVLRASLQSVYR